MSIKSRVALGFTALAFSLLAALPAGAADGTSKCKLSFTLTEWAVGVKVAHGSGTVTCDNGQMAKVNLEGRGVGLAAGKNQVREGHGKFTGVSDINEVYGTYAAASASVGAGKSADAQALTKGPVSLALAAKGTGVELGISVSAFTISKAE
ncbi:MAG TPA: hypothetical protein VGS07_34360 [Thermoanaerobaculia bacterium]|jgi:hypothetical protein|nr:hypothetical protein [Thermoanaerobaculia bacterium]